MSIINIRPAVREGARLVVAFCGVSGSGKTVTALHFAYGLANYDASKIGFLDTENRRGSLNADVLQDATQPTDQPFMIADLYAPFSPERYSQAIHEFQKAGVEVLIIDSVSHEWEGIGGCIDIADASKGMWNRAKAHHKRFMSALLQTDMHIVVCVRAREKDKPERAIVDGKEKTVYRELGLQAIQEKNFLFEMTASVMMHEEGMRQEVIKCPGALRHVLGRTKGYITADDGKAVRDWVDGAKLVDPRIENFRNRLLSNCEQGLTHINACWDKTPADIRRELGDDFLSVIRESARGYDELREDEVHGAGENVGNAAAKIAAAAAAGQAARAAQERATPPPQQASEPEPPAAPQRANPDPAPSPQPAQREVSEPPTSPPSRPAAPANRVPQPAQAVGRTSRPANHAGPSRPAAAPSRPAPARPAPNEAATTQRQAPVSRTPKEEPLF